MLLAFSLWCGDMKLEQGCFNHEEGCMLENQDRDFGPSYALSVRWGDSSSYISVHRFPGESCGWL